MSDQLEFLRSLGKCINLESLIFRDCDGIYRLVNSICSFKLSKEGDDWRQLGRIRGLVWSDRISKYLTAIMPNIKNVCIDDYRSKSGLQVNTIRLIRTLVDRLRCIDLSFAFVNDDILMKIADMNFRDLKEI